MANLTVTKRAPATVTNIGTVAARRRTNGRTKLQQEQKESSRQSLLDAAQRLYVEESYAMTTVDDIVREAQVSRTTFYRHFDSKLAIADALFQQAMMPLRPIHEALASQADPDGTEIALWLNKVLDQLEAHRTLVQIMREVEVVEPDSHSARHDAHKDLIQLYGKRIPAFRQASSDGPRHAEARTRAQLLMLQFGQFLYAVAVRGSIERTIGVRVMTGEFRRFITDFAPKAAKRGKS
jgi:AcrR family transcriptional regulator